MKICVVGAGAIGGMLGAKLALAGEEVTLIDKGAHLDAIRKNGIKLIMHDGTEHVAKNVRATDNFAEAGKHDLVILALKGHIIEQVAPQIPQLLAEHTVILPVQNGVPWWYFQRHGGPHEGRRLTTLDPNGTIAEHIDAGRIIGCVVYPAGEIAAPGSFGTPKAIASRSANSTAPLPSARSASPKCSSTPASSRRSWTTSAPKSG